METNNTEQICCPVCTLYLRQGMTLQSHLYTHPKDQVIEALVRLALSQSTVLGDTSVGTNSQYTAITYQQFLTSTTSVPEPSMPMMLNPCLVTQQFVDTPQPPAIPPPRSPFLSNVIRSPVPLLPYPYYPPEQQQSFNNSETTEQFENNLHSTFSHVTQTTQTPNSPFSEVNCETVEESEAPNETEGIEYQPSVDPFVEERPKTLDDEINRDPSPEPPAVDEDFIETTQNLGTVISNTQRLIANDPTLDYDQDLRTEGIDYSDRQHNYGNLSPREEVVSPASNASNWSIASGLRVRRDLNEINGRSSPPMSFFQMDQAENEYITSDHYEEENGDREAQLTNLENVNHSMGYTVDCRLEAIKDGDIENKEENSEQSAPLNIHSDELMPPRGELSGQESLGATENSIWELQGAGVSETTYPLLDKDRWTEVNNESPIVLSKSVKLPVTIVKNHSVKCLQCEMWFSCVKERRVHVRITHNTPKHTEVKTEDTPPSSTKFMGVFVKEEKFKIDASVRTCNDCGLQLQTLKELRKHRRTLHEARRKCTTCNEIFPDALQYKQHISKVHPLECASCGKLFINKSSLNLHLKRHLKVRPYHCTVCDKSFITRQSLNEHNNVHSGNSPFKCTMCDQTFKRYSNMIQHKNYNHLKMKKKVKDYFCHCGEIFHSLKKLEWHKEIHESKPKQCIYCSERFVHSVSLTRHIRHSHDSNYLPKTTNAFNVSCPICKLTCIKTSLAMHMKIHTGDKPFSCNTCSKEFSTKWNLQLHKWTHASRNSKPYKCKLCKGAFYNLPSYQAHIRSHRNIRPYTCNHCGRQFIRKYNCIRHVKEHEAKKSFCCAVCNKTFHRSYYLTEHMRTHTGQKPYSCHICSKTSSTKSNHNKHVRTHHAREPVHTEG